MALSIHDDRLTRRVGALVLLAAALTVVFVVVVLPRLQSDGVRARVLFSEGTAMREGAVVRVAGQTIGHVRTISIARTGGVVVEIAVDRAWAPRIPINSEFFISARSVLAPRYLEIGPPPHGAPPGRTLVAGDEVHGVDPPNLDRLLQRTYDNLTLISSFIDTIMPATARLHGSIARLGGTVLALAPHPGAWGELDTAVTDAITEVKSVMAEVAAGNFDPRSVTRLAAHVRVVADELDRTIDEGRRRLAMVRAAIASAGGALAGPRARIDRAMVAADGAMVDAQRLIAQVKAVIGDATDGGGSIAAFAADLELVDELKDVTKDMKRRAWRVVGHPSE